MEIINRKLNIFDITPNNYNPNQMSASYYAALKRNIEQDGYLQPLLINHIDNQYVIIDGEHRFKVLKELGYDKLDCWVVQLSENEAKKLTLKMGLHGSYDTVDLSSLIDSLQQDLELDYKTIELDYPHIDLSSLDLDNNINNSEQDDVIPEIEPGKEPITKSGDIWLLGKHKILCGDSTNESDVNSLMDGKTADMVFTDPMYNDDPNQFLSILTKISNHYLIMCTMKQAFIINSNCEWNFKFDIVFNQKVPSSMLNKKVPYYLHKNILYFSNNNESIFSCDNAKGVFSENGYYPSIIESAKQTNNQHGLSKNSEGIIKVLSGFKCNVIADLFLGSGSTLIAAEKTNRICYGMEIDQHYCDIIVQRYINFVDNNEDVKLIRDNKTYNYSEIAGD